MKCEYCIKRPPALGGNDQCQLLRRRQKPDGEMQTSEEAWPVHLGLFPTGCLSFKVGDARHKEALVEATEAMF